MEHLFLLWCLKAFLDLKVLPTPNEISFYYFWCCLLCSLKASLDLKVLSQRLQGMMIPSRWFASM